MQEKEDVVMFCNAGGPPGQYDSPPEIMSEELQKFHRELTEKVFGSQEENINIKKN